jgi:outer membrane protein TolC
VSDPDGEGLDALAERAFRERPEHAELRARIEEARAGIRLAKAARQPLVSLEAAYALQTRTVLEPRSGVVAGVSLSAPLWEGTARRITIAEAEARLSQLKEHLRGLEWAIRLEIERQRLAAAEASARVRLADAAVATAREALDIVEARLEAGRAAPLEVESARAGLTRARSDLVAARVDVHRAAARMRRALGVPEP